MLDLYKLQHVNSRADALLVVVIIASGLGMLAALWNVACAAMSNLEQPVIKLLDAPPSTNRRIRVELAIAIANLAEVDETREQFRLNGFIFATWGDPRLSFNPRPDDTVATLLSCRNTSD